jgi:hypothetical protein
MDEQTADAAKRDTSNRVTDCATRRQRFWEIDVHRKRTLRGDALEEFMENPREWVWRSLLRRVRLAQAMNLAQLSPEEAPLALRQVTTHCSALMDHRLRKRWARAMPAVCRASSESAPWTLSYAGKRG